MSVLTLVAETAFRLHEEKLLSRQELIHILEECVNATALDNGFAEKYNLPFPAHQRRRRRHVP